MNSYDFIHKWTKYVNYTTYTIYNKIEFFIVVYSPYVINYIKYREEDYPYIFIKERQDLKLFKKDLIKITYNGDLL
ncbi:hypothetical protein UFOVP1_39 [uncultured Caudovirales phage]|uniref:Uncharacterized protein n=1 Tax=uncultured Caudovirales phage TaxID=2100421 RepID=A0A6J5KL36_9CAUD|nr:hypothetical protein UFOVP1_39 [uncultured Caudovirales phage]